MNVAERYPLDYDALAKGQTIDADRIEEIVGVSRTLATYSGKQVQLAATIEEELADRGKPVTVQCIGAEIRILTDSEALAATDNRFRKYLRQARKANRNLAEIDVRNLSAKERQLHDREMVVQAAIIAGAQESKRHAIAEYQRRVPGLPAPEPVG
jgi:hypothetical protein